MRPVFHRTPHLRRRGHTCTLKAQEDGMKRYSDTELKNRERKEETVSLQGIIIPSAWDKAGNVLAISLSTFDEEEYAIESDNHWSELLVLLREGVRIRGVVSREGGFQTVRVKDFKRIKARERSAP